MTKLYVASSWRNEYYPTVLKALRNAGHDCYDFRNPSDSNPGFAWSKVDPKWKDWDLNQYTNALLHPLSKDGFANDKNALDWCEQLVLVLPCGRSAHSEAGYAAGQGKKVHVFIPQLEEPELMYLLFTTISGNIDGLLYGLYKHKERPTQTVHGG